LNQIHYSLQGNLDEKISALLSIFFQTQPFDCAQEEF